jgi:hypothetical protein
MMQALLSSRLSAAKGTQSLDRRMRLCIGRVQATAEIRVPSECAEKNLMTSSPA